MCNTCVLVPADNRKEMDVRDEIQTRILCKNTKCSQQLSHRSSLDVALEVNCLFPYIVIGTFYHEALLFHWITF